MKTRRDSSAESPLARAAAAALAPAANRIVAAARGRRLARWERTPLTPGVKESPKRVLVSGATGFIGRHLARALLERGDRVTVLTRDRAKAFDLFGPHVDIVSALDEIANDAKIDAIVNLAGAPLAAGRWTRRRKRTLLGSRLAVTASLVALAERLATPPRTWINASAIGYYGVRHDDEPLHEKSARAPIFQSELCSRWEDEAQRAAGLGVKVALLRIGIVLGADGGALPSLARPVRFGISTVLGSGRQWVSWIHIADLVALFLFVLDEETLSGPLNATAPAPARQADFMDSLAAAMRARPLRLAVPERALRAVLGELAELFVDGQRVLPERATALGFRFRYATVGAALEDVYARTPRSAVPPVSVAR